MEGTAARGIQTANSFPEANSFTINQRYDLKLWLEPFNVLIVKLLQSQEFLRAAAGSTKSNK